MRPRGISTANVWRKPRLMSSLCGRINHRWQNAKAAVNYGLVRVAPPRGVEIDIGRRPSWLSIIARTTGRG